MLNLDVILLGVEKKYKIVKNLVIMNLLLLDTKLR